MRRTYLWPLMILCSAILLALALVGETQLCGQDRGLAALSAEPSNAFTFRLEIGGQDAGIYEECRGLGSSNDVEEALIQTPGGVTVRKKTGGPLEWCNITLKRTEPSGVVVWSWRKAMEDGDLNEAIRDGAITLWGTAHPADPLARWEFRSAWVARLSFDGSIEEMTIVHEGLERTDIVPPGKPARPNP